MDPYYEQRLREEVIFLHSLWHRGPRKSTPNPTPPPHCLQPTTSTQFKKKSKTHEGKKTKHPPPISEKEWPLPPTTPTPPPTTSGWPNLTPHLTSHTRPPSSEEQTQIIANRAQQKALKSAVGFFIKNSDSGEDSSEDDDEMEHDSMCCEELTFFLKVFDEDSELRGYYEKNYERGEFSCLVCGAVGKKTGKRFKNCVALVQHSMSIAKTSKRRAHRAYGQAICKVLDWDINYLPTIPPSVPAKSVEAQGNVNVGIQMSNVDSVNANVRQVVQEKGNGDDGKEVNGLDSLPTNAELNVGDNVESIKENIGEVVSENVSVLGGSLPNNAEVNVYKGESLKEDGDGRAGNEVNDNRKDNVVPDGPKEDIAKPN